MQANFSEFLINSPIFGFSLTNNLSGLEWQRIIDFEVSVKGVSVSQNEFPFIACKEINMDSEDYQTDNFDYYWKNKDFKDGWYHEIGNNDLLCLDFPKLPKEYKWIAPGDRITF